MSFHSASFVSALGELVQREKEILGGAQTSAGQRRGVGAKQTFIARLILFFSVQERGRVRRNEIAPPVGRATGGGAGGGDSMPENRKGSLSSFNAE
jgi:hypothetical protein